MYLDVRVLREDLVADGELNIGSTVFPVGYEEELARGRHDSEMAKDTRGVGENRIFKGPDGNGS